MGFGPGFVFVVTKRVEEIPSEILKTRTDVQTVEFFKIDAQKPRLCPLGVSNCSRMRWGRPFLPRPRRGPTSSPRAVCRA